MKAKWSMFVSELSGKLNGSVAVRGKGGNYIRNRVIPTNANTQAQVEVRQLFAVVSKLWSNLTEEQRDSWNSATETWKYSNLFADIKQLSGKALHQKLNSNLVLNGFTPINLAPNKVEFEPYRVSSDSISSSTGTADIGISSLDGNNLSSDSVYILFLSKRSTSGTYRFVNYKRVALLTPNGTTNPISFGFLPTQIAERGGAVAGDTFGYKIVQLNPLTGENTPPITGRIVVS